MLRFLGFPLLYVMFFFSSFIYWIYFFSPFFLHFILFYFVATVVKKSLIITIKKPGNRLKKKKKKKKKALGGGGERGIAHESFLNKLYNFVRVCPSHKHGVACTIDLISLMNFVRTSRRDTKAVTVTRISSIATPII